MKKSVITIAGLGLASGLALAGQEQSTSPEYEPNRDIVTETERDRSMNMGERATDSPVKSDYGTEPTQGSSSTEDYGTGTTEDYGTDTGDDYGTGTSQSGSADPTQDYESQTSQGHTDDMSQTDPTADDYGTQTSQDHTGMQETDPSAMGQATVAAADLKGKTVMSMDGEEIGEVKEVGYSDSHQQQVAVVEVGGFLGVGEKRIAIPVTKLQPGTTDTDSIQTDLTRETLEAEPEFDDSGLTEAEVE